MILIVAWPQIATRTSYSIQYVGYIVVTRGLGLEISITATANIVEEPPAGLVNSEGKNLFIGQNL
jgi:hypothetical protein